MARRTQTLRIPFGDGQHEEFDSKMLPDGFLARARNVRLRKDGRFGVRYGFTALSMDCHVGVDLVARDVYSFRDRLFAIGEPTGQGTVTDIFEYVGGPPFSWRGTAQENPGYLVSPVSSVRDLGVLPPQPTSVTRMDCAAGGGLVCIVFEGNNSVTWVHIVRAEDDATILVEQLASTTHPRVVFAGGKFFITGLTDSSTDIARYSFDPEEDEELQELTTVEGAVAITAYDVAAEGAGDGWVIARAVSTPAVTLLRYDEDGADVQTITGDTAASHSMIAVHSDGTDRVSYVVVDTAPDPASLYTYAIDGGTLENGPTALLSSADVSTQPGIVAIDSTRIAVYLWTDPDVEVDVRTVSTHVQSTTAKYANAELATKPALPATTTNILLHFAGLTTIDDACLTRTSHIAAPGVPSLLATKNRFITGAPAAAHLPSLALDASTGKLYWPQLVVDLDGRANPLVSEIEMVSDGRRHGAVLGGNLYLAGGQLQGYDGRNLWESGFPERPRIVSATPSTGSGNVSDEHIVTVAVTYEWYDANNHFHTSQPSAVVNVEMSEGNNTITISTFAPHSIRERAVPGSVKVVAWRTVGGKKQLRRAATATPGYGLAASIVLTESDDDVAVNGVIYTQSGRGALSGLLPHESPDPCGLVCKHGQRLLVARLPNRRRAQVSKELFPGEPVQWSGSSSHYVEAKFDIEGVASLDLRGILFGRNAISVFTGQGPNDVNEGSFTPAADLPTSTGLYEPRSILEIPEGVLFQGDPDKIYLLPRGGGSPVSFADPVEDTLASFPRIVAAVLLREEQVAVFCCNNTAGTASRLVVYDLRAKIWSVDDNVPEPIASACEWQGRLVLVAGGLVYLQNNTHPPSAFLTHSLCTGTIKPFDGWGKLISLTFLGELRGACTATAKISYDDGKTFTSLKAHELTGTAGDAVRLQWVPARRKGDRFVIEFEATATDSVATEGLVFNEVLLEVTKEGGSPRLAASQRG